MSGACLVTFLICFSTIRSWPLPSTVGGMGVGGAVGVGLGASVGVAEGRAVGASVGVAVGDGVGASVGTAVGIGVGTSVGAAVSLGSSGRGLAVGVTVGGEGAGVGAAVGTAEGTVVGAADGVNVHREPESAKQHDVSQATQTDIPLASANRPVGHLRHIVDFVLS